MIQSSSANVENRFNFKNIAIKIGKLTPRLVVAGLAGYYILGYMYVIGGMALIDKIAMQVMLDKGMGYIAIGALMPTVQWYAALTVRVTGALIAGLAFDLAIKIVKFSVPFFTPRRPVVLPADALPV